MFSEFTIRVQVSIPWSMSYSQWGGIRLSREAEIQKAKFFYGWLGKAAFFTSMISAVTWNPFPSSLKKSLHLMKELNIYLPLKEKKLDLQRHR